MNIKDTYYVVEYRLRGYDKLETFREDDIRQAYSFQGSIRRFCSHTKIVKHVVYTPSFELITT